MGEKNLTKRIQMISITTALRTGWGRHLNCVKRPNSLAKNTHEKHRGNGVAKGASSPRQDNCRFVLHLQNYNNLKRSPNFIASC